MAQALINDRGIFLRKGLIALLALLFAANGLYMLASPAGWYAAIEGVPNTGPLNVHFVRDIGIAYLTQAFLLFWAVWRMRHAFVFLSAVTVFLGLHALLHVWDIAAARLPGSHVIIDLPGVFLPVLATAAMAYWCRKT